MPVNVLMQFMIPLNVLANTGLRSIGFNIVPTVISPWAPIDIMNSVTTSNSLHPAYDAANMKNAGITDAIRDSSQCKNKLLKLLLFFCRWTM